MDFMSLLGSMVQGNMSSSPAASSRMSNCDMPAVSENSVSMKTAIIKIHDTFL